MSSNEIENPISTSNKEGVAEKRLRQESETSENQNPTEYVPPQCGNNSESVALGDNTTTANNEIDDNFGERKPQSRKHKRLNRGNVNNHQKLKMHPPPQSSMVKKISHDSFKIHLKNCKQALKAEIENLHNVKNPVLYRKQHQPKNIKQNYCKMIGNRATPFALHSKFFLPKKRPRKEIIVPPTKFLLGGNISDPLNLNGLQNESQNPTPTQTPRQSPITTPPKVEVIIPPNIYDPLHLLDPVDSVEYEKQLVSPMKRKSKQKHRHRKKKPKRKNGNDSTTEANAAEHLGVNVVGLPVATISNAPAAETTCLNESLNSGKDLNMDTESNAPEKDEGNFEMSSTGAGTHDAKQEASDSAKKDLPVEINLKKELNNDPAGRTTLGASNVSTVVRSAEKEKPRDLKLDLSDLADQYSTSSGGVRKRRISEGPNKTNKFRRLDSMDKIVSPVVPQPGAWKRPPWTNPTGARKCSRLPSTSFSENELISPTEDNKSFESINTHCDTPKVDAQKLFFTEAETQKDSYKIPVGKPLQGQPQADKLPKFKADGYRYQYGNFDRYSGCRNIDESMDVRLEVFHRNAHLFRGKDILDIGCNAGHIAIAVGKALAPKSILGVDIDKNLIARARRSLSLYVRIPKDSTRSRSDQSQKVDKVELLQSISGEVHSDSNKKNVNQDLMATNQPNEGEQIKDLCTSQSTNSKQQKDNANKRKKTHQNSKAEKEKCVFFPISLPIIYGGIKEISQCTKKDNSPHHLSPEDREFPKNVFFRAANYVLKDESLINNETQQYDVILCLSVTKWIHLNFGDAGLKLAFKRMFNQLRPGGKLILEAQNWASYKKKRNLTATIYNNYKNIEFFPNKFHEYLLGSEVGFSHSYCLGAPRHMNKGFCRPIQLYAKGDYTPNHVRWSDNYHPQTPYEAYRGIYAGMARPRYPIWGPLDTPRGNSGSYSCRQTPIHPGLATSQYYNPLESDSYLPSYDTEVQNRHYVFASPLYQTVWSPPASLRNASNKTPLFGSIREADTEECVSRHVYPPNDFSTSPQAGGGSAFNSVREPDNEDGSQQAQPNRLHVYASCDDLPSSFGDNSSSSPVASREVQSADRQEANEEVENNLTENGHVDYHYN